MILDDIIIGKEVRICFNNHQNFVEGLVQKYDEKWLVLSHVTLPPRIRGFQRTGNNKEYEFHYDFLSYIVPVNKIDYIAVLSLKKK